MRHRSSTVLRIAQGAVAGAVLAVSLGTLAKSSELDTGARSIPYTGTLERDGAGYTGVADFQFTVTGSVLYDGGASGAVKTWTEQHDDVNVYSGKFSVKLGAQTTTNGTVTGVPDWLFNDTAVYITIAVREGASTGEFTSLTGRQRLHPTPFTYWAAEGSAFRNDGNLEVGGGFLMLGLDDGLNKGSNTGQHALVHSIDGEDALVVNWGGAFEGGTRIQSKLSVTDKLTVDSGGLQVTSGDTTLQSGSLTLNSGSLTMSNGKLSVTNGSATEVMLLTSGTGTEAGLRFKNAGNGEWTIGAGGGVGTNDFFFFNANTDAVAMEIESDGDVNIPGNLTVSGTISHTASCPGTTHFSPNKDNGKSRLCVYRDDTNRTWNEAVRYCWDNVYGSQLCTVAQLRIACMSGMSLATNHWTADRAVDDEAFEVNNTNCDNFDGDVSDDDPNGAYCCLYLRAD